VTGSLVCVSLDRRAPVSLHEWFRRRYRDGRELLHRLGSVASECMLIRTCERFEVYVYSNRLAESAITDALSAGTGCLRNPLSKHICVYRDRLAARHLFRVAAGLESRVIGEPCIQGQVRAGFLEAQKERALGAVLSKLGRTAIHCGRCVRRLRGDSGSHPSLADAAVDLLIRANQREVPLRVAILGTGRMGKATVEALRGRGLDPALIVSRSAVRARCVGGRFGIPAAAIADVTDWFDVCNALIACASGEKALITIRQLRSHVDGSIQIIDLGMPRNVDPAVGQQSGVQLFGPDALQRSVHAGDAWLHAACNEVERTTDQFIQWLAQRRTTSAIRQAVARAHRRMNMSDAGSRKRLHRQIMDIKRRAVA